MTDPQLVNNNNHTNANTSNDSNNECNRQLSHNISNNNNNFNNNNIDGVEEPKYQHKKFKKMVSSEFPLKLGSNIPQTVSSNSFVTENEKCAPIIDFKISSNADSTEFRKYNYICPHCKLSCNKPSVLQKHIRAHTNERPYPCGLCGFAFKTKSNLYKHYKSKAHLLKKEDGDIIKITHSPDQFSDESDISSSDSISNDVGILPSSLSPTPAVQAENPSNPSPNPSPRRRSNGSPCSSPVSNIFQTSCTNITKVYKPKFHSTRKQCMDLDCRPQAEQLQKHIERIITENEMIIERFDQRLQKCAQRKQNTKPIEKMKLQKQYLTKDETKIMICPDCKIVYNNANLETHKHFYCKKCESLKCLTKITSQSISTYDSTNVNDEYEPISKVQGSNDKYSSQSATLQPMSSPGPLLGNTRLVDSHCQQNSTKRPRLETCEKSHSCTEIKKFSIPKTLQMFGGEVRILNKSGESKTMRIEPRTSEQGSNDGPDCQSDSETTSVVVRSSLHSGGTMLHKSANLVTSMQDVNQTCTRLSLASIMPNISPPSLAPSISYFDYLKPANILHAGKIIPHVPGIPGPQTISINFNSTNVKSSAENNVEIENQCITTISIINHPSSTTVSKFLRPCSLPLKPGTFTPKRHHGITPTTNTLPLISPETPRPKKSYGQLYLNGHAYTYLGLKCSTRLFYCTLNRTQPMYVTQQHGLSMYSNWKICKEAPPNLELFHYDSRHRLDGYTLASSKHIDILTHSSQQPNTPSSFDSDFENDFQGKHKSIKLLQTKLKNNEDSTHVCVKGHRRFTCSECGILCKKSVVLKKHIKIRSDVQSCSCANFNFSFKRKGNLTEHRKSKFCHETNAESQKLPVLTHTSDEKLYAEQSAKSIITDEVSSSNESEIDIGPEIETEAEGDESEISESEECDADRCLLNLAESKEHDISGLIPLNRPSTYPYVLSTQFSSSIKSKEQENLLQSNMPIINTNYVSGVTESRLSVIHTYKKQEATTAPIDLTVKPPVFINNQSKSIDIFKNIAGPALLQSIVQTMDRLPSQTENEWVEENTNKEMFEAYLTERYMKDNKIKEQYKVLNDEQISINEQNLLHSNILNSPKDNQESESTNSKCSDTSINLKKNIGIEQENVQCKIKSSEQQSNETDSKLKMNLDNDSKPQFATQSIITDVPHYRNVSLNNPKRSDVKSRSEFIQPMNINPSYMSISEDTRNVCSTCNKVFSKQSQLRLHINIHYFERPFRCESCGTSFRTKGHLTKHERSTLHHNKVNMTSTFGAATSTNPRPFKCTDCKSAFRIHGHLAKHLRSKMHIMKLECLRKLPFGTYAEMERSGINLNDIDTTDCDTSLLSLQTIAQKLCKKDYTQHDQLESEAVIDDENSKNLSDEEVNFSTNILRNQEDRSIAKNNEMFKCQMCSIFFQNSNELQMHYYVEHKHLKICVSEDNLLKEKKNTHKAKNDKTTIVENKEQNVDAT